MHTNGSPVSITTWPLVVKAPAATSGHISYQVYVRDSGKQPIQVTANSLHIGGACQKLSMSPGKFTLQPGQIKTVTVTDATPHATDVLASFTGTGEHAHGFAAGATVGSRLVVGHPHDGTSCAVALHASRPVPVVPPGFPVVGLGGDHRGRRARAVARWPLCRTSRALVVMIAVVVLVIVAGICVVVWINSPMRHRAPRRSYHPERHTSARLPTPHEDKPADIEVRLSEEMKRWAREAIK
jgi:hypothetical protein